MVGLILESSINWAYYLAMFSLIGIGTSGFWLFYRHTKEWHFFPKKNLDFSPETEETQLNSFPLPDLENSKPYQRYLGYLFENKGSDVIYYNLNSGNQELGIDLLVREKDEVIVIGAKYWNKFDSIPSLYIFQLFGAMTNYKRQFGHKSQKVRAMFFTSARISKKAREVAENLEIELVNMEIDINYPRIKCCVSHTGKKHYFLPDDTEYDSLVMTLHKESCFVQTVDEATSRGFVRQFMDNPNTINELLSL